MEAALVLPTLLVVAALLAQPLCLLYTRAAMEAAAAETARLLATGASLAEDDVRAFVGRCLAAVPDAPAFHDGGADGWEVDVEGAGTAEVRVRLATAVRPLPFFAPLARALGAADGRLKIEVEAREAVRPSWLGGSYGDWVSMWE